ncbi:MAG: hypothetical protein FWH12_09110 [Treponema sp.]|nr:hypothetical protein [Treponema sp.]
MNHPINSHLFWGSNSPLATLSSTALIILASSRFAFALVASGALLWVYVLSALVYALGQPIMPQLGRRAILLFTASLMGGIFMILLGILNPLLLLGCGFFLFLIPPSCMGSRFYETGPSDDAAEFCSQALSEALMICIIILALALIREPLGMRTLSFPGGSEGIVELFESREGEFIPIRILSVSAGGLLLLGYGTALFRYFREQSSGIREEY